MSGENQAWQRSPLKRRHAAVAQDNTAAVCHDPETKSPTVAKSSPADKSPPVVTQPNRKNRTRRGRRSSLSIVYQTNADQSGTTCRIICHMSSSDPGNESSDKESILSIQSKVTAVVKDSTDDLWFLDTDTSAGDAGAVSEGTGVVSEGAGAVSGDDFYIGEYEVTSDASDGAVAGSDDSADDAQSFHEGLIVICSEGDLEFFADAESSDVDDPADTFCSDFTAAVSRSVISKDMWACPKCSHSNRPIHRFCDVCWTLRPDWLPVKRDPDPLQRDSSSSASNIETTNCSATNIDTASEELVLNTEHCITPGCDARMSNVARFAFDCDLQPDDKPTSGSAVCNGETLCVPVQYPTADSDHLLPAPDCNVIPSDTSKAETNVIRTEAIVKIGCGDLMQHETLCSSKHQELSVMVGSVTGPCGSLSTSNDPLLPCGEDIGVLTQSVALLRPAERCSVPSALSEDLSLDLSVDAPQVASEMIPSISAPSRDQNSIDINANHESLLRVWGELSPSTSHGSHEGFDPVMNAVASHAVKPSVTLPVFRPHGVVSEWCVSCLSRPKDASMVHGQTGHQACCFQCARKLQRRGLPCPICRRPISRVIRNYVV